MQNKKLLRASELVQVPIVRNDITIEDNIISKSVLEHINTTSTLSEFKDERIRFLDIREILKDTYALKMIFISCLNSSDSHNLYLADMRFEQFGLFTIIGRIYDSESVELVSIKFNFERFYYQTHITGDCIDVASKQLFSASIVQYLKDRGYLLPMPNYLFVDGVPHFGVFSLASILYAFSNIDLVPFSEWEKLPD